MPAQPRGKRGRVERRGWLVGQEHQPGPRPSIKQAVSHGSQRPDQPARQRHSVRPITPSDREEYRPSARSQSGADHQQFSAW